MNILQRKQKSKLIYLGETVLALFLLTACSPSAHKMTNKQASASHSESSQVVRSNRKSSITDSVSKVSKTVKNKVSRDDRYRKQRVKLNAKWTQPYKYQKGKKKFKMEPLDKLGRARLSHIQLNLAQLPHKKRSQYITVSPSGWHNYRFSVKDNDRIKETWLFNRGHLVGYQFCGINNDKRNLVAETAYLNQGSLDKMDVQNKRSMLYYENGLRNWMSLHPQYSLDYSVRPVYQHKKDLVPSSVVLTFMGYDANGKPVKIDLNSAYVKTHDKISYVNLANTSPQAKIDYKTGTAIVYKPDGFRK